MEKEAFSAYHLKRESCEQTDEGRMTHSTPNRNSKNVVTNQEGPHPKLITTVKKHLASHWRKPKAASNAALKPIEIYLNQYFKGIVLDSFCGTGESTKYLSTIYPEHLVIGIEKSSHRLSKHVKADQKNYVLLHAKCEAVWSELAAQSISVDFHYIFYPNPWPKAKHLMRRVHGHPTFYTLTQLGGQVELRSNWACYVEEFGIAMTIAGAHGFINCAQEIQPLTPFERKFANSGHVLYIYKGKLPSNHANTIL